MIYELWSTRSRNLVGSYDTEEAAISAVRDAIGEHGAAYAARLALVRENRRGRSVPIASGLALVERAESSARGPKPVPDAVPHPA